MPLGWNEAPQSATDCDISCRQALYRLQRSAGPAVWPRPTCSGPGYAWLWSDAAWPSGQSGFEGNRSSSENGPALTRDFCPLALGFSSVDQSALHSFVTPACSLAVIYLGEATFVEGLYPTLLMD